MSIISVRSEIAKHYRNVLGYTKVFEHGGNFSIDDIKRYAQSRHPSIVIGCLGIPSIELQGTVVSANIVFGAFCMSSERNKTARDIAALSLVESVISELPTQTWNGSANKVPKNVSGSNLYTSALDKLGIAMWAARWDQQVDLERNTAVTLDDFLTMTAEYDIGQTEDTVNTTDTITLPT